MRSHINVAATGVRLTKVRGSWVVVPMKVAGNCRDVSATCTCGMTPSALHCNEMARGAHSWPLHLQGKALRKRFVLHLFVSLSDSFLCLRYLTNILSMLQA